MRRLTKENINTPEFFDKHFSGELEYADIARLEKLIKHYKGGPYMEVGCFDSPLPIIVKERFPEASVWACDFSPRVIEVLKKNHPEVTYVRLDARDGLGSNSFDYVVAGEVIEHMEDPEEFIENCVEALRKDGWLAISTPLEESDRREVGEKQHLWSFTEQDFKDWGFETEVAGKTILAWKRK